MARINLLPWRAERRKARLNEFYALLGVAALGAVLLSALIVMYYNGRVDGQNARNAYLQAQITEVDAQIALIADLDKKKARLLKRKEVIEELQSSRSQMVHLFDELVRTVPDGLRLNNIQQNGDQLTLAGFAQSNARVSMYMRNLQASGWMTKPELKVIEAKGEDKGLPYSFSLTVTLTSPAATQAAAAQAAGIAPTDPNAASGAMPPAAGTAPAVSPATPATTPATAPGGKP
jgi:type IV pilus assembly protein PilN